MIPVKLELKNFLPYRTPDPLRFEGIHLASLTGHNGAGKSSLLDAITWALWGRARARTEDELVHIDKKEMYVQLVFEQEGQRYRVLRQRKRGKRGQGQGGLEFFIQREDGEFHSLREPSMRETQRRINEILRLDYETFVHSAYLQQGRADAFTIQRPAERKRILAEILGLDQWQIYEERAKERLKRINTTLAALDYSLREIERELAQEPQFRDKLAHAQRDYEAAREALEEAEALAQELAHVPHQLQNVRAIIDELKRQLRDHADEIEQLDQRIHSQQARIQEHEAAAAQRDEIEAGYAELQAARQEQSELSDKLQQLTRLNEAYNRLEQVVSQARAELQSQISAYDAQIADLEATQAQEDDLRAELDAVKSEIDLLSDYERQHDELKEENQALEQERAGLHSAQEALAREGKVLNERLERLENVADAACPLCGQPLTDAHRDDLLTQITEERDDKRAIWRKNDERLQTIKKLQQDHKKQMIQFKRDVAPLETLRTKAGALQTRLESALEAGIRLEDLRQERDALREQVDEERYAEPQRQEMQRLMDERAALNYDAERLAVNKTTLETYQIYDEQRSRLQRALDELPRAQEDLAYLQRQREKRQQAQTDDQAKLSEAESQREELTRLEATYRSRQEEVKRQRERQQRASEDLTVAQQRLKTLDDQRENQARKEQQRAEQREQHALYEQLKLAFSKNGVPAMMIEAAIPELEAETNDLLARMTDGRMHLRMETQRETNAGDTRETLDIAIADELGTRNYEMYSGGEAFRINFAIRVALSKMLARRQGAHLRTLFIDEGFGSQDDDGRDKLVSAITAIQNDFDLILVITHLDDLRDSFPVHIIVEKTPNGSMFRVR